jgi:DNA-binding transcriptional ArsR family regulator
MVLNDLSPSDLPTLRGNPFDSRPIERNRASEIVGRDDTMIRWKEHMHSQSPRMILLTGARGSGRTSLINAISSLTDDRFVGTYWHSDDPLNCSLDELAITFCGHDIPSSMHQKVERIVETMDTLSGPLPLVALDYPSHVDLASFLSLILPTLHRLRALVVVSVSNSQMASLDENTREVFDEIVTVDPLSREQIQSLSDLRIRRMSPERWHINSDLMGAIMSRTGGNPRSVIGILRDLVDEGRGLGSKGTLESLTSWSPQKKDTSPDDDLGKNQLETVTAPIPEPQAAVPEEIVEDWHGEEGPDVVENVAEDEDWDVEPDDMWSTDEGTQEESVIDEIDEEEHSEILPDSEITSENPEKITGWAADEGTILSMDEGTEPPSSGSNRGFSGLVNRSKITNVSMPKGPDFTVPIQEPDIGEFKITPKKEPTVERQKPITSGENRKSISTVKPSFEEKKVLFSEGELWTVDSDLEETLPELSSEPEFEPDEPPVEPEIMGTIEEQPQINNSETPIIVRGPSWESKDIVDQKHLGSMSDAERLVVSVASSREISPSDAEIQARLEVGRPRLSQIYNSLLKSGILAVRKEGRSRLFKLSEGAGSLLSEV